jgi:hypothetical protein
MSISFVNLLKMNKVLDNEINEHFSTYTGTDKTILTESSIKENYTAKPEEILRAAGFKINLITPSVFGLQIDFAKKYEDKEILDLLKEFKIKIKSKSIFIIY